MPTIRQLEYLVALAETRHFRKAAERVHVSQPTLSMQVKTLEQRLGAQLVERNRSMVVLTALGQQIAERARRVLREVRDIRELAKGHGSDLSGVVRLGVPPTIGPYLLPKVIPDLHDQHPELKLYVREDVPKALPLALEDGVFDVVLAPLPVPGKDLESWPLFREPLLLAMPSDDPLAGRGPVERSALMGRTILALESGHQLQEQVQAVCEQFGATISMEYEGTSLDAIRQMVALGMGMSFLPALYVHSELPKDARVHVSTLKARSIYRTIGMVHRRTSARTSAFRVLADLIRDVVGHYFPDLHVLADPEPARTKEMVG